LPPSPDEDASHDVDVDVGRCTTTQNCRRRATDKRRRATMATDGRTSFVERTKTVDRPKKRPTARTKQRRAASFDRTNIRTYVRRRRTNGVRKTVRRYDDRSKDGRSSDAPYRTERSTFVRTAHDGKRSYDGRHGKNVRTVGRYRKTVRKDGATNGTRDSGAKGQSRRTEDGREPAAESNGPQDSRQKDRKRTNARRTNSNVVKSPRRTERAALTENPRTWSPQNVERTNDPT